MPRKQPAKSAAAAASATATPTFTSFAAATAAALPTYAASDPSLSSALDTTPWDKHAISLLKKLTKRDPTTKLRAIADLTTHLNDFTTDVVRTATTKSSKSLSTGAAFTSALPSSIFPLALDDPDPSVRAALLSVIPPIIATLRRVVQPALPTLLPSWVAACADSVSPVAIAAKQSLETALSPPDKRKRAALKFAPELRAYASDILTRLRKSPQQSTSGGGSSGNSGASFRTEACRALAVMSWLFEASEGDISTISPIIDAESDCLSFLAHPPKAVRSEAPVTEVVDLAVAIVTKTGVASQSDDNNGGDSTAMWRSNRLAAMSLLLAKQKHPQAWTLALSVLRSFPKSFGDTFGNLPSALSSALTPPSRGAPPTPAAFHVVLPLLDALPHSSQSSEFANIILQALRNGLGFDPSSSKQPSIAYEIVAHVSYVEALTFVIARGIGRWCLEQDCQEMRKDLFETHILPTLKSFGAGEQPRVAVRNAGSAPAQSTTSRRRTATSNEVVQEREKANVEAAARLLRQLDDDEACRASKIIGEAFVEGLKARDSNDLQQRHVTLLDKLGEKGREVSTLASFLLPLASIVEVNDQDSIDSRATTLAKLLDRPSSTKILSVEAGCERVISGFVVKVLNALDISADEISSTVKHVGSVCSWLVWASTKSTGANAWNDVLNAIASLSPSHRKFSVMTAIVREHARRRQQQSFSPCEMIKGGFLEEDALLAARVITDDSDTSNINKPSALRLLSVITGNSGASISTETFSVATAATTTVIKRGASEKELDNLIIAILRSPTLQVISEDIVDEFTSTSVLRASKNDEILTELVESLGTIPLPAVKRSTTAMADVIKQYSKASMGELLGFSSFGSIVAALGERDVTSAVTISVDLLSGASPQFMAEYLKHIPFKSVFGDDEKVEVCADELLDTMVHVSPFLTSSLVEKFHLYFQSLQPRGTRSIARKATSLALQGQVINMNEILQILLSSWRSNAGCMKSACDEVCLRAIEVMGKTSDETTTEKTNVPRLISILTNTEGGTCFDQLEPIGKHATSIIRRDPSSSLSMLALNVLSALLSNSAQTISATGKLEQKWVVDSVSQALKAVRRTFQQPHGVKKSMLSKMETHSSLLMANAIIALNHDGLLQDDYRFWLLRCKDSLENLVNEYGSGPRDPSDETIRKLLNLSKLAFALVQDSSGSTDTKLALDTIEEICHWGSWSATLIIPVAEEEIGALSATKHDWDHPEAESSSNLVLEAAKRGVLFSSNQVVPVDRARIYALLPYLSSSSAVVRNAVVTLVSFFAAVDIPEVVEAKFPKKGFRDEEKEVAFATNILPAELRHALEWRNIVLVDEDGENTNESEEETTLRELRFFLAWRLFLDMIRIDERVDRDGAEGEVSVRRIGITFLQANEELFADFFNRMVEVVVDGSPEERTAATRAAVAAIRSEETRAPQGAQLAPGDGDTGTGGKKKGSEPVTSRGDEVEGGSNDPTKRDQASLDQAVGQAAGVTFAKALQRLPAMSRQHMNGRVDRGKTGRVEAFSRRCVSPLLIEAAVRRAQEWGMFEGDGATTVGDEDEESGTLSMRGSVGGREVRATYTFSDVTLELGLQLPETFPLHAVVVEAGARKGMSEARWQRTLMGMTTTLLRRDGSLAEAVQMWRRNLDKTFQGAEECPICYSVLHLSTGALPQMQCRTCHKLFHSDCLCKWFTKSNSSACPLCRSAF